MQLSINMHLHGTSPMLQHNGRLANPLDEHTMRVKQLTAKRTKTDEDLAAIAAAEARGGCWETRDGLLGLPAAAVWRSVFDGAKAFKQGENIKRALRFDDVTVPLVIDGAEVACDAWLADPANIDYRPVKIMGRKTMRARPRIPEGWEADVTFSLLSDIVEPHQLEQILERSGELVGVGDWRPTYGRFQATIG